MKKYAVLAALAFSFGTAAFAQTYTGVVSDEMCARNNTAKASSSDHAACAEKCIKGGSPAVLIIDGKVVPVTNPDKIASHAGHKITVEGSMKDGKLTVEDVKS